DFLCPIFFDIVRRWRFASDQGRTASYPTAPSQIPACGITAPGFSKLLALHMRNGSLIPRKHEVCVVWLFQSNLQVL
ncbi:MAG: hypothetical protein HW390_3455, partial [Candidatus Brocadiaceae bacterium]|nr:hypothetical protein [Candidatus Brocadiaceae bacterium]